MRLILSGFMFFITKILNSEKLNILKSMYRKVEWLEFHFCWEIILSFLA